MERIPVPDEKVPWDVKFEDYKPVEYTSENVLKKPIWADPDIRFIVFIFLCIQMTIEMLASFKELARVVVITRGVEIC